MDDLSRYATTALENFLWFRGYPLNTLTPNLVGHLGSGELPKWRAAYSLSGFLKAGVRDGSSGLN